MKPAVFLLCLLSATPALAAEVRPIPPPGITVPNDIRAELALGAVNLGKEIAALRIDLAEKPDLFAELPNVEIFWKAVDWALRYDEFFDPKQFGVARELLAAGAERARALREGRTPWNEQTSLVVRGYRSQIDGSVQPYGLVIPDDWKPADRTSRRLDVWFRGRQEKGTELPFLDDRMKNRGEFAPPGAIVLHPFGRYCNANKFAGESDLFEALADVRKHYPIDENRLAVRGFSMGGAAAWQFATHHPGMWAAAAPGAGFAETAEFFNVFAPGKEPPPWWEQVLWRWYDSTTMAANLAHVPTIAYSGELDKQKQAADIMLRFAEKEGLSFPHIIGPQTGHKYHPEAKGKIEEFVTGAMETRHAKRPLKAHLTTYSLLYPERGWLQLQSLERHWERADLHIELADAEPRFVAKTRNVAAFTIDAIRMPSREGHRRFARMWQAEIDGEKIEVEGGSSDGVLRLWKNSDGRWSGTHPGDAGAAGHAVFLDPATRKTPWHCGPIDHAFTLRFVFVRPTGKPVSEAAGAWARAELEHAITFWRKVFRGDAPVVNDTEITAEMIENANLVLFGDPASNKIFHRFETMSFRENGHSGDPLGLPFQWSDKGLTFRGQTYDAAHHTLALIFPNPLNPRRYLVLNSGPTFREQALLNNSDQTPKLPDWAVIDLRTPPGPKWPGLVVDAGFFDEQWRLPK